jgi:hypothetical protein
MIVIPSHRRAKVLASTLAWLESTDVPLAAVTVVVSDEHDRAEYSASFADRVRVVLPPGRPTSGLVDKLNAIHYGVGDQHVLVLEDDSVIVGDDRQPVQLLQRVLDEGREATAEGGLWGVAPHGNPYYYGRAGGGLRLIVGFAFGFKGTGDPALACTVPFKHDYERTCRYYARYGSVHRCSNVGAKAKASYKLPGGLQAAHTADQRAELERESCLALVQAYPAWLAPNATKKSAMAELRFLRGGPAEPAFHPAPLEAWPCGWLL